VASRLTDKLVILLILVNSKHFANAVTVGNVSHADQMRMQTLRGKESEQFSKSSNSSV